MRGRFAPLSAGILAATLVCLVTAIAGIGADWKRLDSPNFVVVGNVSAGDLLDVARRFEGFRETLGRLLGQRVAAAAVPTIVVVFASDRDFMPYKPVHKGKPLPVAGVYLPGPDINHIAMRSVVDDEERRIIFHEYTHEALSSVLRDPPVWFGEGIAEYYSTFEVRDQGRRALIGRPIASHVLRLRDMRLLPLETLLAVRHDSPHYTDEERRPTFYAESWALVHFLLTDAGRRVQLSRFLSAVTSGAAPVDAWREIFGSAVESALRKYVQQVGFAYVQHDFPEEIATLEAKAVPLSGADAQVFLAGLLMSQRRHDEAAERLGTATTLEPGHPRAAVMLGRLELARDDYGGAAKRFAGLRDVEDWLVAYEAGSEVSRMFNRPGVRAREDDVSRVRRLFDQVARHRGEFANALARMVSIELWTEQGPTPDSLQAIRRARELAPGRDEYAFLHAQVLARTGDFRGARGVLGPFLTAAHAKDVQDRARALMEYVLRLEDLAGATADAQAARGARTAATPPLAGARLGEIGPAITQPEFRALRSGEQRVEGTLERIDCAAGGAASFQVRTADGVVAVVTRRMAEVEFITYRDDLKGDVKCGALTEPMPVYVTWRSDAPSGAKQVVAIEFLPKPRR